MVQELKHEGVLISPRMMADHMPDYLTAVLQRLAEHAGCDMRQNDGVDGDVTIDIPPSPPLPPHRGRASIARRGSASMETILTNSLATGRAFADGNSEDVV